ncbi:MAG: ABC transporter permease subunit [Candidatus Omnitrophica bacterium]|nr:ABC transporter permease subunit [Candidatus Omnitrophota bacterium]
MRTVLAMVRGMLLELLRKKDFYVFLIFMLVLLGILSSRNFFSIPGISRYTRDFGYTLVMLFSLIVAVVFSAKQVPSEIASGTVYTLLAKPVSRFGFVFGKFCGGVAVSVISFSAYFAVFVLFCLKETASLDPVLLLQSFYFGILFFCMVCSLVVFFSVFLTMSANVAISFLLYFFISGFSDTLREAVLFSKGTAAALTGIAYYLVPHFEFFDLRVRITHGWDPLDAWVVAAITVYTAVYCLALLYFAGVLFRRKRL